MRIMVNRAATTFMSQPMILNESKKQQQQRTRFRFDKASPSSLMPAELPVAGTDK